MCREAEKYGRTYYFGRIFPLCHIKHSEIKGKKVYKGRVIFRGDIVRDESGFYAVFSEQGTSASHMAAAKFMDAIANFPGNEGEDGRKKRRTLRLNKENEERRCV